MLKENKYQQSEIEMVIIDDLVPENHLLRIIDKFIDFKPVQSKLSPFYCKDNGRPAIDPVVLFKIYLIGYLFGIRSDRQLMREIEVNLAYRWFLGYKITDKIPHHSTLSSNRRRRFQNSKIFEEIFDDTVFLAKDKNLIDGKILYTDSTHLKANANKKKFTRQEVAGTAKSYMDELELAVDYDRESHGKKELKDNDNEPPKKEARVSTTDPDSGFLMREGKEETFAYLDHRTVDGKFNIITDVHVTAANIHDSIPYIGRLDRQIERFGFNVKSVGLDAGYNTVAVCHELVKRNIFGVLAYKRPSTNKLFIRKKEFSYDKENDVYVCPGQQHLIYKTTQRNGYRVYASNPKVCSNCKFLKQCNNNKQKCRVISRHVWEEDKIKIASNRLTSYGREIYKRRKETIERSFADAKQLHGYRYARLRGLWNVSFQCFMTAICQNLKKIASILNKRRLRNEANEGVLAIISTFLCLILNMFFNRTRFCYKFGK